MRSNTDASRTRSKTTIALTLTPSEAEKVMGCLHLRASELYERNAMGDRRVGQTLDLLAERVANHSRTAGWNVAYGTIRAPETVTQRNPT